MAKQDDGLFLLEVLIDKIVFVKSPCFSDKEFRTCVNIQCPAVDPLEICDDDPGACIAKSGGPFVKTFNNGKSCLFSLKQADIATAMSKFPIKVSVYKSLPCGCLPTKINMGEAVIDMTKEFVQARKQFLEDPTTVSYQALKDSFRIVGPDKSETGEIVMFLRISCFGKLIITRFQGAGGPPNLGAGSGGSAIVDRSCNPRKDFQSTQDPCACGAARVGAPGASGGSGAGGPPCAGAGGGYGGVCPIARDPYNSMPCEDPDDPCYCSGPKPAGKPPMVCKNTDQYCLHVPKGALLRLPFCQELTEDENWSIRAANYEVENFICDSRFTGAISSIRDLKKHSQSTVIVHECLQMFIENINLPVKSYATDSYTTDFCSTSSLNTIRSKKRSVSFSNTVNCISRSRSQSSYCSISSEESVKDSLFGKNETTVYMTLFDDFNFPLRTSGTQATASINKCLQVSQDFYDTQYVATRFKPESNTTSTTSTIAQSYLRNSNNLKQPDIYFFGRKKEAPKSGMGSSDSKTRPRKTGNEKSEPAKTAAPVKKAVSVKSEAGKSNLKSSTQSVSSSTGAAQTQKIKGSSAGTCTKVVSIKDEKPCPSASSGTKGDMVATVSHIRIGPRDPCPIHGKEPCQGPKCIIASSAEDQQAPVKVTTVTNPRRGVFELVVRRMTGAPLARNELMLEWTPPPSRPPPCGSPCPTPCSPPGPCRPPKCKMIVCRPSLCKPKCCKRVCKKPCGPIPISVPCNSCKSCCGRPCRPCKPCKPCPPLPRCKPCRPCKPPRCRPCPPCKAPCGPPCCKSPCGPPCCKSPCGPPCCKKPCAIPCTIPCCDDPCNPPCRSSPCLRPCPVGRRRPRKARSQPRMRAHKIRISPCCNRSKFCPAVRCRSVPGPCFGCCGPPCPPRKCCSVYPCKVPKFCKSSCSTCCGA